MSQTTFYSKNYVGWPPVHVREFNNPDSDHWHGMMETAEQLFWSRSHETLPENDIERFYAMVGAHLAGNWTYKDAYLIYHNARMALAPGVTLEAVAHAAGILPDN